MARRKRRKYDVTTKEWLDSFLAYRRLEKADGRLLKDYRCEDGEYGALVEALASAGRPDHPGGRPPRVRKTFVPGPPPGEWNADDDANLVMPAFAMYGSEWFRRDWDGERRKIWQTMMWHIGWSDSEYWELYPRMASGLQWWNLRFIKVLKTHYLETIAYQSGMVQVVGIR